MNEIKKSDLLTVLKKTSEGELSAEQLQEWMIHNYDPGDIEIGKGELGHTVDAMNIVMNEYEIVELDKIAEPSCALAIAFITSSAGEHEGAKKTFLKDGFID